jgi:hypothetical protein
LAERLPENIRNPIVRQALSLHVGSSRAAEQFAACLAQIGRIDARRLATRQQQFFRSLGQGGVETIAGQLLEFRRVRPGGLPRMTA